MADTTTKGLMGRRCPACGVRVPAHRWFFNSDFWNRWPCEHCGRMLRIDDNRRLIFCLVLAILVPGISIAAITLNLPFPLWYLIVLGIIAAVVFFFFDAAKLDPEYTGVYCPKCKYQLRDRFSEGCPECGWGREP